MEAASPPKRWYPTVTFHGVTTQEDLDSIVTFLFVASSVFP